MNTELLRETLQLRAGDAPASAGLLDAVRARSQRLRRNRQVKAAGAAVVAVALAVAGPAVVRAANEPAGGGGTSVGTAPPTQPAETEPVETAPADPAALVPPTYDVGAFPFTPGWAPPGTSEPVVYTVSPDHLFLAHETPDGRYAIHVEVAPTDPDVPFYEGDPPDGEPVTVQGRQGELRNTGQPSLVWQHRPDLWVKVEGETVDDVKRYAESLTEQPLPVRPPFTLDLVPAGAELGSVQPDAMRFEMRDAAACAALAEMDDDELVETHPDDLPVCGIGEFIVRLFRGGPGAEVPANFIPVEGVIRGEIPQPPRETIQVGDHEAELIGDHNLHVLFDNGTALGVTALGDLTLSREELVRVALGVQVLPDARSIFE
jgi:hypothetical protein